MYYDPHEPGKRLEMYAKNPTQEEFFTKLNNVLLNADILNETNQDIDRLPLIYIVGAPRSGTTLLSQVVSRYLPVGYINNLIARFWSRPSVGIMLSKAVLGENSRDGIEFKSSYGTTHEITGPHEFGYFWRYWLLLDNSPTHHLTNELLSQVDKSGLKKALENEILASFKSPVAFKNVICGFHASFLTEIHPASLFIHIKRDPYTASASILKARMTRYGSYDTWWSLKPSSWPFNTQPGDAAAEVATQVMECRREIDEELSKPGVKSLQVTYEELCTDTQGLIEKICHKLKDMGSYIDPVSTDYPALTVSAPPKLPDELEKRLKDFFS